MSRFAANQDVWYIGTEPLPLGKYKVIDVKADETVQIIGPDGIFNIYGVSAADLRRDPPSPSPYQKIIGVAQEDIPAGASVEIDPRSGTLRVLRPEPDPGVVPPERTVGPSESSL